jgi:hypothetical protein
MTGRFITALDCRHEGTRRKSLIAPLVYEAADGTLYTVPAGFVSDGASVPRVLWMVYPPFGENYEPAAWLHDYLYQCAELVPGMTRDRADGLLEEAAEAWGFRGSGARVLFAGVRAGGWRVWGAYRRAAACAAGLE